MTRPALTRTLQTLVQSCLYLPRPKYRRPRLGDANPEPRQFFVPAVQSKGRREAGKRRNAITVTTDSDERTNERTNEQLGKPSPPPHRDPQTIGKHSNSRSSTLVLRHQCGGWCPLSLPLCTGGETCQHNRNQQQPRPSRYLFFALNFRSSFLSAACWTGNAP